MNKSEINFNAKKFFAGIVLVVLAGFAVYAYNKGSTDNDELQSKKRNEVTFYDMVHNQFNSKMGSISAFTQSNAFYMTPDDTLEKAHKECSPMFFKVLNADSLDKGRLKSPDSPLYQPTYDCISLQIDQLPVKEKTFIKFMNSPRFEQYKNVPEVKKVIEIASQDSALTMGEALTIIKTIDQAEKRIAMDKFKNN